MIPTTLRYSPLLPVSKGGRVDTPTSPSISPSGPLKNARPAPEPVQGDGSCSKQRDTKLGSTTLSLRHLFKDNIVRYVKKEHNHWHHTSERNFQKYELEPKLLLNEGDHLVCHYKRPFAKLKELTEIWCDKIVYVEIY